MDTNDETGMLYWIGRKRDVKVISRIWQSWICTGVCESRYLGSEYDPIEPLFGKSRWIEPNSVNVNKE